MNDCDDYDRRIIESIMVCNIIFLSWNLYMNFESSGFNFLSKEVLEKTNEIHNVLNFL